MREFLLGNEAIARGAWEAGVKFVSGYPGTPSTEIIETLATRFPETNPRWSTNEKVAFEEGMGAAIGGLRTLVTMKHVGLNVAADAFMVFPYSGTNGGFVVISADDPGMHSSQNEQDNRYLARVAKVPVLEPSDAQECHDFMIAGLELSEQFRSPVMLRTTTRLAHHKGLVEVGERADVPPREFIRDPQRFSVPIYRLIRRPEVEKTLTAFAEYAETCPFNRIEEGADDKIGVVTSGISYQYVKEVLPDAGILRLGMTFPLPANLLRDFCAKYETVYVVEEGEPFIEEFMRGAGITNLTGKELFGVIGEYSPGRLRKTLGLGAPPEPFTNDGVNLIMRPPMFCVGCGHRTVFAALRQLRVTVSGDIGCYTMGALHPYEAEHTTFAMGSSIGVAVGLEQAGHENTVAIIGDSTFIHAGIPPLIDAVYNRSRLTLIILDNSTTGMTGSQPNPVSGKDVMGQQAPQIDLEALCRASGVENVAIVDTWDRKEVVNVIRRAVSFKGPAVVIARGPCQQIPEIKHSHRIPFFIHEDLCTQCDACFKVWCPAITRAPQNFPVIAASECTSCTVCAQVCPTDAIKLAEETA
ncbi:MAG TPA: indolepyruvate ferredoxin oxidoreductase subunit alpha [Anaerolineales bacterium]|jgi:indolepyruvate ferredoxin oxidoreductase alpha subunit|nr:indolepyruvate ferredoxin oxidoreductase subunit alpha [Anaerolineales bacterium]HQX17728.1 indolepyruvate ferredoxin oxidoreductase subunit alpha [Anaerolineales bacterium]